MSKSRRSNQKVSTGKIDNQKSIPQNNLAVGTIISSNCDYNGLVLEYHLSQTNDKSHELVIYFRMINFQNDYVIGLNLQPVPSNIMQLVYAGGKKEVINRVPKIRGDKVILLDGCRDFLTPDYFSALRVRFEPGYDLQNLDMWIHTKADSHKSFDDGLEDLKIPDLVGYKSPRLGLKVDEAYPQFPSGKWWLKPCNPQLVDSPPIPKINWGSDDSGDENNEKNYDVGDEKALKTIEKDLKALVLDINLNWSDKELGYNLTIKNEHEPCKISIATQNQVYIIYVPGFKNNDDKHKKTSGFSHLIETLGPVQSFRHDCKTLLAEKMKQWFHVQYVQNEGGLWLIFHNELEKLPDLRVEIFFNQQLINTQILKIKETGEKFYIPFDDHGEYFYKVILNGRLISQYQLSRVKPSALMTAVGELASMGASMGFHQDEGKEVIDCNVDKPEENEQNASSENKQDNIADKAKKIINFVKKLESEETSELPEKKKISFKKKNIENEKNEEDFHLENENKEEDVNLENENKEEDENLENENLENKEEDENLENEIKEEDENLENLENEKNENKEEDENLENEKNENKEKDENLENEKNENKEEDENVEKLENEKNEIKEDENERKEDENSGNGNDDDLVDLESIGVTTSKKKLSLNIKPKLKKKQTVIAKEDDDDEPKLKLNFRRRLVL